MKFTLCELDQSGEKTKIYSPLIDGDNETLYEQFISEHLKDYRKEVINLDERLYTIGHKCGLFDEFFDIGAGRFGENICKFKDKPKRKLRLFFIEYGNAAIIVGGGGSKPINVKATQDKPILWKKNRILGLISIILQEAEKAGHFSVNPDGTLNSTTNFTYNSEDYEYSFKEE